jgi:SNF2 family DNA or RNA helicase
LVIKSVSSFYHEKLTIITNQICLVPEYDTIFPCVTYPGTVPSFQKEILFLHRITPRPSGDEMVQRFAHSSGPRLFFLSLKADGLGLNLTRASHVFHIDRWRNPAGEDQATDRAYRIGQLKNVAVHLRISAGTLKERIDLMIEEKRTLAGSII